MTTSSTVLPSTGAAFAAATSSCTGGRDGPEHLVGQRRELLVLRDEVGLARELDDRGGAVLGARDDDALGGGTVVALGDGLRTLDAEQLDGLVVVAVGLDERVLRVHHAGAEVLAELLHVSSGEVCH
ncbi:hypothetical protein QP157_12245 [Sphingomonas sp. LR61]